MVDLSFPTPTDNTDTIDCVGGVYAQPFVDVRDLHWGRIQDDTFY